MKIAVNVGCESSEETTERQVTTEQRTSGLLLPHARVSNEDVLELAHVETEREGSVSIDSDMARLKVKNSKSPTRDSQILSSTNGSPIQQTLVGGRESTPSKLLDISSQRICQCGPTHINCLTPKEWLKSQIGVWQFFYQSRDIRDKKLHPATFPISLAKKVIELFTHQGELVLDPFVGSGTVLVASQDVDRNAVGFDLQKKYVDLSKGRLANHNLFNKSKQLAICDDARNISHYLQPESVGLIFTSPPYANLLNRRRRNKSRRDRNNEQLGKIEQYSQDPRDLGTMPLEKYTAAIGDIFEELLPLLRPKAHCVINVPDMWWENKRITIHVSLIQELRQRGYELRNVIIWDRTNVVNQIGIFGWPSNYITMGVTFEYLLDFWRPPAISMPLHKSTA